MSNEVATNPAPKPLEIVRKDLSSMQTQFENALPAHVPPERFIRIAMTAISMNGDLQRCERTLLYAELMKCAQDGLLPDGREAAIAIYGGKPRYMPMVGGICKKARNSGEIKTMNAHVVYSNDEYDSWTDELGDHFKFRKARGDRGTALLTFAFALTKDDGFYFEEVSEEQMQSIEACSKAKSGPWKSDFRDEMKRKSAIRRLAKYRLPSSTDLDEIIRRDDDMYDVAPVTPEQSKLALAEHQAERDFLPGIKPPQTATQFCEKLKGIPGGPAIIWAQYDAYAKSEDHASCDKLMQAITLARIPATSHPDGVSAPESQVPADERFPFETDGK